MCNTPGCTGQTTANFNSTHECDVCVENHKDHTERLCAWCDDCEAYICQAHWNNWPARIKAAAKRKLRSIIK